MLNHFYSVKWNVKYFKRSASKLEDQKIPMITAAVTLVVDVVAVVLLLLFTDLRFILCWLQ